MELLVSGFQAIVRDVCVDLSGVDAAVAEHHLYRPQIRAVLDQRCCEAVAQHVRRDMSEARLFAIARDYLPEFLSAYRISIRLYEHQIGALFFQHSPPDDEVILQEMD